ncbi:SAM-dependent chlorinase/fluorinase [bacterium]|nr:SAM-dependent chlorinase/fluorinase [candidate division CSSED10-310 bacterium]
MPNPVISLITDFGNKQHLVGSMKGVIAGINPEAEVIDVTHEISPFDIVQAAFVLQSIINYFPVPTIHIAVVDPGVGSERKPILAVGEKHYYLCPDNGIITRVLKEDNISKVIHIDGDHYMLKRRCETFHGRDVFAPVSAWLSKYFNASLFGEEVSEYTQLDIPKPLITPEQTLKCQVLFKDNFGNLITNFELSMMDGVQSRFPDSTIRIRVGDVTIEGLKSHYFEVQNRLDPLALFGSMDLLEIAVREGNAAEILKVNPGDPVYLSFSS